MAGMKGTKGSRTEILIGVYGVSGCGKSYLLEQVRNSGEFPVNRYLFCNGSAYIEDVVGDMQTFKKSDSATQTAIRETAIKVISRDCAQASKVGVVAGHYMLWETEDSTPIRIGTEKDWSTYTHIIYLKTDPGIVARRRKDDVGRDRGDLSVEHLRRWQDLELKELRKIACDKGILLATVTSEAASGAAGRPLQQVKALLEDFRLHRETLNSDGVSGAVRDAVEAKDKLKTVLVFDADKTLAPVDTGALFWSDEAAATRFPRDPQRAVFNGMGYTYTAFRQAMLLHEEFTEEEFEAICDRVAGKVKMFPEFMKLLDGVADNQYVEAVVVTCGLHRIWQKVLSNYGYSHVTLIGGGRLADRYVMTDEAKKNVVDELHRWHLRVVAFGDSPLDIPMLRAADDAYIIVCGDQVRSKSMETALGEVIEEDGWSAVQVVLPADTVRRLDLNKLPKVTLDDVERERILSVTHAMGRFYHATDKNSAKLLMTATRDAANRGPALRKAHQRVGEYLATEYLSNVLGLEEMEIRHVQGKATSGHGIRHEKATLIIPAMRGGEPMALGISTVLAGASFVHAKKFGDIEPEHFKGRRTVILVDSVINTGTSMAEDFVKPIRKACPHVRIVVVAGVVQANTLQGGGAMRELLQDDVNLYVVALRESQNCYKGQGTTDTGDRLFNTTYM